MTSPFPGMDPYLEAHDVWPDVHHGLASEIQRRLNAQLPQHYFAGVESYTITEELTIAELGTLYPDTTVFERLAAQSRKPRVREAAAAYTVAASPPAANIPPAPVERALTVTFESKVRTVAVRDRRRRALVTSIEILSPVNKRPGGDGLIQYRRKRARLLRSTAHLLEIDLLRGGERPGPELSRPPLEADYVVLLSRSHRRPTVEIWPIALSDPLPLLPVPLKPPDADLPLDLGSVVAAVYEDAGCDRRIDYGEPVPPPPLTPEQSAWVAARLQPLTTTQE